MPTTTTGAHDGIDAVSGRPTTPLPTRQLLRLSLYWLGLTSIAAGLTAILGGRLEFDQLVDDPDTAGRVLFGLTAGGTVIAMAVQPTVGAISDYTISRWGRRKPYIFIGTILDLVFLTGIALSQDLVAIAAFIALLQFSSNVAQGPFQGYVPDLVPGPQVGLASALVGMMQILGSVTGFVVGGLAIATGQFALGLISLGVLEFVTMLSVVVRVPEGRTPKTREGRSWFAIAASAWGTDLLMERSFLWLVSSRLAVLTAGGILTSLATFYLARSHGMDQETAGTSFILMVGLVAVGTVVAVVPAARLSDRIGRKRVIYMSCAVGAAGMATVAMAPGFAVALVGAVLFGLSAGVFLAVDWALMTDIIPKASSGRYMGLANVATASSGILAVAIGGTLMDLVGGPEGPRAAVWLAVVLYVLGALLLRPVDERRREDAPVVGGSEATATGGRAPGAGMSQQA